MDFHDDMLGEAFILVVDPQQDPPMDDPFEPGEVALPIWLMQVAMGTRIRKPLRLVYKRLTEEWSQWGMAPNRALLAALYMPRSPYAIGWDRTAMVLWRGEAWIRHGDGSMDPSGMPVPVEAWPTAEDITTRIHAIRRQERS